MPAKIGEPGFFACCSVRTNGPPTCALPDINSPISRAASARCGISSERGASASVKLQTPDKASSKVRKPGGQQYLTGASSAEQELGAGGGGDETIGQHFAQRGDHSWPGTMQAKAKNSDNRVGRAKILSAKLADFLAEPLATHSTTSRRRSDLLFTAAADGFQPRTHLRDIFRNPAFQVATHV